MKKYRIKDNSSHVVGPLLLNEAVEFILTKEKLDGLLLQIFPLGDWDKLESFPEIIKALKEAAKREQEEVTKTNTVEVSVSEAEKTEFREFKFQRKNEVLVDYNELQKKLAQKKLDEAPIADAKMDEVEKTRIVRVPNKKDIVEKTRVVQRFDLEDPIDSSNEDNVEIPSLPAVEEKKEEIVEEKVNVNERTMMVNIKDLLPQKIDESEEIEQKLLEIERLDKAEKIKKKKKKKGNIEESEEKAPAKKRNLSIAIFLAFMVIFLLPDSKESKVPKVMRPKITFPVAKPAQNEEQAKLLFKQGLEIYEKDTYTNTILAAAKFSESMSNKFRNNEALPYLILAYSELLKDLDNKFDGGKVVNQLLNIAGQQVLSNPNTALGAANYYEVFDKNYAAINIIETYLRLNRPTPKIYAKYLSLLIDVGDFVKAKVAFEKLSSAPKNDVDVIYALGKYYLVNEQAEKADELYLSNKEKFEKNIRFLANYGDILLKISDYKRLLPLTIILLAENGGGSPVAYAQALKYMGYIKIATKEYKEVTKAFKQSLELNESEELRGMLATLDIGGDKASEDLIIKSKIAILINKAKIEVSNLNWEKAFRFAIEASDLSEEDLDAKIFLANLQVRRGYFTSAISTLNKLREYHPLNLRVNYLLVMANLKAYKLNEAKRLITTFSTIAEFQNSYEYLALLGYYYAATGNDKLAFDRFLGALSKNPLRDEYYYEMAKIAYDLKKFKKSREFLSEAMKLDPFNFDYKILYSKVLYDLDDVHTAIGYLRKELEKTPDNPKLLGQIGIFYYQDQNFNEYKLYREKLSRLTKSDEALFDYLVSVADLEKDYKALIENAEKLLLIAPGKLDVRMKLAQAYFGQGKYQDSLNALDGINERLDSYPKLHYFKAYVYLTMGKFAEAEVAGKKEIEANPGSEYGYYVLGETYLKVANYNEAKKMLEKAIQIKPDYFDCLLALGWLKMKQGQPAAARELYMRALRGNENNPEIRKRLGYVYKEIGQSVMAVEQFKIYLELNPAAEDRGLVERIMQQLQ